jgi:lysozyme family protein
MRFDDALERVLFWEGGFSNHPDDPGGPTNYGITQRTLSHFRGRFVHEEELRSLTPADAAPLYEKEYWRECRCQELPDGVDLLVFDCAVNQGPDRAKRLLQRAVTVAEDGILGPVTMKATSLQNRIALIDEIASRRAVHYASLQRDFHLGWYRRLVAIHRHALE